MPSVAPWVAVRPQSNPLAILGTLPMASGTTATYTISPLVVPASATGILVFAWATLAGNNPAGVSYWHMTVTVADGSQVFFSLLVDGPGTNSQAFWLPMPADGTLAVSLSGADLSAGSNSGEVEIHGYYPGAAA